MKTLLFFEDMVVGDRLVGPSYTVRRDELVEFAKKWDPLPFHVDEAAGRAAFGSQTAMSHLDTILVRRRPPAGRFRSCAGTAGFRHPGRRCWRRPPLVVTVGCRRRSTAGATTSREETR